MLPLVFVLLGWLLWFWYVALNCEMIALTQMRDWLLLPYIFIVHLTVVLQERVFRRIATLPEKVGLKSAAKYELWQIKTMGNFFTKAARFRPQNPQNKLREEEQRRKILRPMKSSCNKSRWLEIGHCTFHLFKRGNNRLFSLSNEYLAFLVTFQIII